MAIKDMTPKELDNIMDRLGVAIRSWDLVAHYVGKIDPRAAQAPVAMANEMQSAQNWLFGEWYKHR